MNSTDVDASSLISPLSKWPQHGAGGAAAQRWSYYAGPLTKYLLVACTYTVFYSGWLLSWSAKLFNWRKDFAIVDNNIFLVSIYGCKALGVRKRGFVGITATNRESIVNDQMLKSSRRQTTRAGWRRQSVYIYSEGNRPVCNGCCSVANRTALPLLLTSVSLPRRRA